MPTPRDLLRKLHAFLKQPEGFIAFPLSFLLYGLEKLIEIIFSCPCTVNLNKKLTVSIFIGPALFSFALMFLLLRPFRHGLCLFANDETQQSCPTAFAPCLILPVMWSVFLLLDGDYVACAMTDWMGVYVFDDELNRFWCKPTAETYANKTELRDQTCEFIHESQFLGYVVLAVYSVLVIIVVGIYDCFSGKTYDSSNVLLERSRQKESGSLGGLKRPQLKKHQRRRKGRLHPRHL